MIKVLKTVNDFKLFIKYEVVDGKIFECFLYSFSSFNCENFSYCDIFPFFEGDYITSNGKKKYCHCRFFMFAYE